MRLVAFLFYLTPYVNDLDLPSFPVSLFGHLLGSLMPAGGRI